VGKLIGGQIQKFASARDKEVHEHAAANIADTHTKAEAGTAAALGAGAPPAVAAPSPPPEAPFDIAKFAGVFGVIGLALGALGSALALIAAKFFGLAWWEMPLVFAGAMLAVSGPSMLLAWLQLRARNLGPILDANGWAVNARAHINVPFGASLTAVAALPAGAERSLADPFADEKTHWVRWAALALVLVAFGVAWELGYARTWLHTLTVRPPAPAASSSASGTMGAALGPPSAPKPPDAPR
jgi:hypothetical protein